MSRIPRTDEESSTDPRLPEQTVGRGMAIIFDRVRRIPPGFVATYGDLSPGAPRQAGRALSQMPPDLPWWRVVRADGSLAKGSEQRRRLEAEGVPFRGERVALSDALIPAEIIR